jgi:Cupin domain/Carboxypeptidase regulatory-like domain
MRCASTLIICLALAAGPGEFLATAEGPQATQTPPPKPAGTVGDKPRQASPPASRLSLTAMVTAMDGKTLPGVRVKATGPADREGRTDDSGLVTFQNVAAGTYRLRFEHEEFVTLEKEVSLPAGRPLRVTVTLSAAPPPPPPPKPEPVVPSAPPVPDGNYSPSFVSIPDFFESNYIGRESVKRSPLGCGPHSSSTLVQTKDAVAEHTHAEADEIIYVVAGEGTHRMGGRDMPLAAGSFVFVPRGDTHTLTRRGSRPLIFLSTLAGPPCQSAK